jgi:molybdenum cofactor biosynthesis protein B
MAEEKHVVPRVLVAAVMSGGVGRALDAVAKGAADEIREAKFHYVRTVVANGEPQFIQQLVSQVSNDNQADVILMIGGTGIGARDRTCEAVDAFVEHRIEGFGEAFRRMLADEFEAGPSALLARATAGVYNQCVVFAMTGPLPHIRRAVQKLVVPTLDDAVAQATGRVRVHDTWFKPRPS